MRILRERADATAAQPPRFAMGILTLAALSTTAVGPVIGGVPQKTTPPPVHNKHAAHQTRRHLRAGRDRSAKRHSRAAVRAPHGEIVRRTATLASAFRARSLPVVLVNVAGRAPGRTEVQFNFTPPADWIELVPELDRQPSDYTVTKQQIGAFYGTALEQILRRRGVTQVVLAGVATSIGVEATARKLTSIYNVTLVVDAMTDLSADAHRHSGETIFPQLGETVTTDDVILLLAKRPH